MKPLNLFQSLTICLWLIFFGGCQKAETKNQISDALRERAIQELENNLHAQSSWVKVHMAEYKLWSGYKEGVEEEFLSEKQQFESDSPYRIGIWRVLAQASKDNAKVYINKIFEAFRDSEGTDRIHAAETLAKLGLPIADMAPDAVEKILKGDKSSLYVYTLWGMANSSREGDDTQNILFEFIDQHQGNELPLMQAAYALRNYGNLSEKQWEQLAGIALREPKESIARVYLLSAAYVQAPDSEVDSRIFKEVHDQLLQLGSSESKGERMEMALALGERGTLKDLPVLLSLLNDENPKRRTFSLQK